MWTKALTEFDDYPAADLPVMPEGFTDDSWHNDICPHMTNGRVRVWVDFIDPAKREFPENPRFCITLAEPDVIDALLVTDDWDEVLRWLATPATPLTESFRLSDGAWRVIVDGIVVPPSSPARARLMRLSRSSERAGRARQADRSKAALMWPLCR